MLEISSRRWSKRSLPIVLPIVLIVGLIWAPLAVGASAASESDKSPPYAARTTKKTIDGVMLDVGGVTITPDGDPSDWAGIPPIIDDADNDTLGNPEDEILKVYVTHDSTNLYLRIDLAASGPTWIYFDLDTDQKINTGYNTNTDSQNWYLQPHDTGIDYMVEVDPVAATGELFAMAWNGSRTPVGTCPVGVGMAGPSAVVEVAVPLAWIGEPAPPSINMDFQTYWADWGGSLDEAPDTGCVTYPLPDWTFMVYLDADIDLEGAAINDLNEMELAGSTSDVNIVVLLDRILGDPEWDDTSNGNWTTAKLFYVTKDADPNIIHSTEIADWGEVNMGHPTTLADFIEWTVANYPAQHYALVLWDHGGGWTGVCEDWTGGYDLLTLPELKGALATAYADTGVVLDIVGFDASVMGMLEVGYQIRDYANIMVGSEETEPGDGWPYDLILTALTTDSGMTADALAAQIVDDYIASYFPATDETQSAVALSIDTVANEASDLAAAIISAGVWDEVGASRAMVEEIFADNDYVDLYHFADLMHGSSDPTVAAEASALMSAITVAVIAEGHGTDHPNAHGLSIYFPASADQYNYNYETDIDFSADSEWDEFLVSYYAAKLKVEISSPAGTETYSTCQHFDLTFTIHNNGQADALDVRATVDPGARAEVEGQGGGVSWTTPILDDIPGGGTIGPFTYEMHCMGSGDSTITVTPAGTDENTLEAITDITEGSVTIKQETVAMLKVEVTSPAGTETYSTCQHFDLSFTIHNNGGADALDVRATVDPGARAEVEGQGGGVSWTTPILDDIPGGGTIGPFTYEMHCMGSGDSTITVTPAGTDENTLEAITDITEGSVTIKQETAAMLKVEVTSPAGTETYSTCQHFDLTFTIHNNGQADALDVRATVDPGARAEVEGHGEGVSWTTPILDDIPGGGTIGPYKYEMHCTNSGDSTITLTPAGTDENTLEAITDIIGGSVIIKQETAATLKVEIGSPAGTETYSTCQHFDLSFTIHNSGQANALDVRATIDPGATVEVEGHGKGVSWTTPILDDIPGGGTIGPFTYEMHCMGSGDSTITVTPAGTDENSLEAITDITGDSVTIKQETAATLKVEIGSPVGTETYSTCQHFDLTFIIDNSGEADALDVRATIDPGATVEVEDHGEGVSWTTPILGDIPGGGTLGPDKYEMHCTSSGDSTITLTPAGTDENTLEAITDITGDSVTIEQVSGGLSLAAIVGIAVGSCVVAGLWIGVGLLVFRRRRAQRKIEEWKAAGFDTSELEERFKRK